MAMVIVPHLFDSTGDHRRSPKPGETAGAAGASPGKSGLRVGMLKR